jgi:hypothetical protein
MGPFGPSVMEIYEMELEKYMDKMDTKLDNILVVVSDIQADRAVMKDNIDKLEDVKAADRLTKIETSRKTSRYWIGGSFTLMGLLVGILEVVL